MPSMTCIKNLPVWSTTGAPSCELSIVLNDEKGIAEKCNMLIIKSRKEQILEIQDRTWAYFFPEPITVRFDCLNEYTNPKPFILVGSGTLVVPLHCTAISNSFKIRHSIRGNSSLTTELPSFHLPPLTLNALPILFQNISLLPLLDMYKPPSESSDWTVSTEELETAKKNNRPIFRTLDEKFEYYSRWSSRETLSTSLISSTGLGVILVVTAIALYFCWRCKSARYPNDIDIDPNNRLDALQLEIL